MRGRLHGVETRLLNDYPKALYSYCWGHNLNLIGQDGCKHISMQNATAVAKDIANYVKRSPKRQRSFEAFCMMEDIELSKSLRPLCMTRWVYRKSSLDSLMENYDSLLQWFYELTLSGSSEEKVAGLAYTIKLTKCINYFSIRLLQRCFALMHYTHKEIQRPSLSITAARVMVDNLIKLFKSEYTEEEASNLFQECCHKGRALDDGGLGPEEPEAPRIWLRNERSGSEHNLRRGRVGITYIISRILDKVFLDHLSSHTVKRIIFVFNNMLKLANVIRIM